MKVSFNERSLQSNFKISAPVIGLQRKSEYDSGKEIKAEQVTCHNDPAAKDTSDTYKVKVRYLSEGTPEDVLNYFRQIRRVHAGQGLGNEAADVKAKFKLIERTLEGAALGHWQNAKEEIVGSQNETQTRYEKVVDKFKSHFFPKHAAAKQKRALKRTLRKPADMSVRDYVNRCEELNHQIQYYPADEQGKKNRILPTDERIDNYYAHLPSSYQKTMVQLGFDPIEHNIDQLKEFCETRLEPFDNDKAKHSDRKENPRKRKSSGDDGDKSKKGSNKQKYCRFHGHNSSHTTNECKKLDSLVKSDGKSSKSAYSKKGDGKKYYSKEEALAMAETAGKQAAKSLLKSMKRRKKDDVDGESFNYNEKIEQVTNGYEVLAIEDSSDSDSEASTSSDPSVLQFSSDDEEN